MSTLKPEIIEILNFRQLAEITMFPPLHNNTDAIFKILQRIKKGNYIDTLTYMSNFNIYAKQKNLTTLMNTEVKYSLLDSILRQLSSDFSWFTKITWKNWFQNQLVLLLPNVNQTLLNYLPTAIDCDSFQALVKGMDNIYEKLSDTSKEDVYNYLKKYGQANSSGLLCDAQNSTLWVINNLGRYISLATYEELVNLNRNFNGFEVLDFLNIQQIAEMTVFTQLHNVSANMSLIFTKLKESPSKDLERYILLFNNFAQQRGLITLKNATVRDAMLGAILNLLSPELIYFNYSDWKEWFQSRLTLFLPSMNKTFLKLLPFNITCEAYQSM
ncbi:uncharacterized protein LOC122816194 [Protopterus annectens]|uniref:uncharacterized protein LOC122816194 n=1 Tax=Protopterus annectens TaxID=7888 RepID=UPI001CFC001A|nr:uncharacterized protein LOC122816194 [Protopterus annectens]